jgi:exodeoxyribonuclease-5
MKAIDLTTSQTAAIEKIISWFGDGNPMQQYFVLSGYAGTGKTTIARELARRLGGGVFFGAYTGKAAHVLAMKADVPTYTIHHLIYTPEDKPDTGLLAELRAKLAGQKRRKEPNPEEMAELEKKIALEIENLRRPNFRLNTESPLLKARLVVVDEHSMIDEQMGNDLMSFRCPVLALGDPGQLPPVNGKRFFTGTPNVLLTQIHRTASDNPIIDLSRRVREGELLKPAKHGDSEVVYKSSLKPEQIDALLLWADQVLVGKNKTRHEYNNRMRKLLGFAGSRYPIPGDKLVCLRNNKESRVLNGQIWMVDRSLIEKGYVELWLGDDEGRKVHCKAHKEYFDGKEKEIPIRRLKEYDEFDYGYALTVHKAQGSEWDKVVLFDEWHFEHREEWLYTGITRAAKSIFILR